MTDQRNLSDFTTSDPDQTHDPESYICTICGSAFDSAKGRGIHRSSAHTDSEIRGAMLEELRRLDDTSEGSPTQREMDAHVSFSAKSCQEQFGSWNAALQAAGLALNKAGEVSEDALVDELIRLSDELGESPTSRDMAQDGNYAPSTYINTFGTWNAGLEKAGLPVTEQRDIPRDDLVTELTRLADALGEIPTSDQMETDGAYSVNAYVDEFGSWNAALRESLDEINRQREVTESDLKAEIRRLEATLERVPTANEMKALGQFGVSTFASTFGSWNEALREAGYQPRMEQNIERSTLRDELERVADSLGRTPTAEDMEEHGEFGWTTYKSTFGSWNQALREAGLDLNVRTDIPENELREELHRLRDEIGHVPERREMDQSGRFDSTTYMSTFGSWNEALIAADMSPNKALYPAHLDHIVRSRWELAIANRLLAADVAYEYESIEIAYGEQRTYTPDFVTDNYVIEVKGHIYDNERQKARAALRSLDEREYVVVGTALPADIHIPWDDREEVMDLFDRQ